MLRGSSLRLSACSACPAMSGAQHRDDVGLQRVAHIGADLAGRALGGLERDIAGKALGDDHVDRALADVVALDEAVVGEARAAGVGQDVARLP